MAFPRETSYHQKLQRAILCVGIAGLFGAGAQGSPDLSAETISDISDRGLATSSAHYASRLTPFGVSGFTAAANSTSIDISLLQAALELAAAYDFREIVSDMVSTDSTLVESFSTEDQRYTSTVIPVNPRGLSFYGVAFDNSIPPIYQVRTTANSVYVRTREAKD